MGNGKSATQVSSCVSSQNKQVVNSRSATPNPNWNIKTHGRHCSILGEDDNDLESLWRTVTLSLLLAHPVRFTTRHKTGFILEVTTCYNY